MEVHEITVEVDVVLVHPPQMRKTVGIQRMQYQHGHARALGLGQEYVVVQQRDLATRSAEPLHAMRRRAEQQQAGSPLVAEPRKIDRKLFSLRAAFARMDLAEDARPARLRRGEKLLARLAIALGKMRA